MNLLGGRHVENAAMSQPSANFLAIWYRGISSNPLGGTIFMQSKASTQWIETLLSKRLAESESFGRMVVSLLQKTVLEDVLDIVCAKAKDLLGATGSAVLLLTDQAWLEAPECIEHDHWQANARPLWICAFVGKVIACILFIEIRSSAAIGCGLLLRSKRLVDSRTAGYFNE